VTRPLKALIVEDNPDDAELLLRELRRSGFDVTHRRVQTRGEMERALGEEAWDIVLSDYSLPRFNALEALSVLQSSQLPIPFIILSGTIGEETAVEALKAGAQDFLVKGRFVRLSSSITRALDESRVRRERREAEEALRTSEQKYRRIVETSQEGVWVIDAESKTTYVNSRMAEILGEPSDALHGVSLFEFIDDDWTPAAQAALERRRAGIAEQQEFKFVRRGGAGDFWALLSTSPILDDAGQYAGALSMVMDITEKRKLQAQLMVSDRMASVGILAAGVAHEINNPLAAVIANLDLAVQEIEELANGIGESSTLSELRAEIADAREGAERVRDIVRDLKIFSRVRDEERRPVDVQQVLDSSARMAWNEIRHRARLVKHYEKVPPVHANEPRLGQVFLNLIVNAAQAIEEGRADENEIRLVTRVGSDGRVLIEVHDTGSGMTETVIEQLFTPFFTTKPIGVGTGLGLSICHRIVTSIGGELGVETEAGKGSCFRVQLPATTGEIAERAPATPASGDSKRRASVLVIDDEEMVGSAIRRALSAGHDVTVKTNAPEALAVLQAGAQFDVVLCDLMMPHMTGMEFYAELERLFPDQASRVVFLTGGTFTVAAREFLAKARRPSIEKPFDVGELRAIVDRSVG
jgi:PAS domain S-box-containing protein